MAFWDEIQTASSSGPGELPLQIWSDRLECSRKRTCEHTDGRRSPYTRKNQLKLPQQEERGVGGRGRGR